MGSIFSVGGILGDSSINGPDQGTYLNEDDFAIGSPVDNSQYSDTGQDPTSRGGGLSSLSLVIDDAFKAFQISQTPTSYRAASPQSPAAIAAKSQAQSMQQQKTLVTVGAIVIVIVVLYLLFKK